MTIAFKVVVLAALVAVIAQSRLTNHIDKTVFVRADARAPYGTVAQVFGKLQTAGADSVGLLTSGRNLQTSSPFRPERINRTVRGPFSASCGKSGFITTDETLAFNDFVDAVDAAHWAGVDKLPWSLETPNENTGSLALSS